MKRFVVLLAFPLLLAACGGSGDSGEVACEQQYWDGTYGTCLPSDWAVLDPETLHQRGVPEGTIVAFQSNIAVSGQFPTVAVTREVLAKVTDPLPYSEASIRSVTVLPSYTEIDIRDMNIDGNDVRVHMFTAQPIPEEPTRRYYQLTTVADGAGYTVTATTPVSVQEAIENQILFILQNTTFVAPTEEE